MYVYIYLCLRTNLQRQEEEEEEKQESRSKDDDCSGGSFWFFVLSFFPFSFLALFTCRLAYLFIFLPCSVCFALFTTYYLSTHSYPSIHPSSHSFWWIFSIRSFILSFFSLLLLLLLLLLLCSFLGWFFSRWLRRRVSGEGFWFMRVVFLGGGRSGKEGGQRLT